MSRDFIHGGSKLKMVPDLCRSQLLLVPGGLRIDNPHFIAGSRHEITRHAFWRSPCAVAVQCEGDVVCCFIVHTLLPRLFSSHLYPPLFFLLSSFLPPAAAIQPAQHTSPKDLEGRPLFSTPPFIQFLLVYT